MTYTWPLRRTIRHLAHRLRTEGETFMQSVSLIPLHTAKDLIIQVVDCSVQSNHLERYAQPLPPGKSRDSQDERFSFGDGNRMLKVCRQ